ncbi:MAG: hypothetical protein Q8Q31_02575 [Nanoarchaeota archaeon]|nr:hypothetical protein [Nanoarchaeota archaeon]
MKRAIFVLCATIFLLAFGFINSQAYELDSSVRAGATVNAGGIGAGTGFDASASSSAGTNGTVEAGSDVNSYVRGLPLERKNILLNKLNARFGLNLTLSDIESMRMRLEVRESILEEMRAMRAGIAGNNPVAIMRADTRASFMANLSLFIQNMTLSQKQETVARINSRYGLNLSVNDLDNKTIRKEVRDLIEMDLRAQLAMMREERAAMRLSDLARQRGWMHFEGRNITVRELAGSDKEILVGRINAKYKVNITADDLNGNVTNLRARLSNGQNASIKIMPDRASEVALTRLRAKCLERNCTVVLKEVGEGSKTRLAYEVKTEKDSRVLFLFKKKMMVQAKVDAETGQIIGAKKPWWAFLASEKDATEAEIRQEIQAEANAQAVI